jgi:hypothetical protein
MTANAIATQSDLNALKAMATSTLLLEFACRAGLRDTQTVATKEY